MFTKNGNSMNNVFEIKDITSKAMKSILNFSYKGHVTPEEIDIELLVAAERFAVTSVGNMAAITPPPKKKYRNFY
jgi:hypothetical protein